MKKWKQSRTVWTLDEQMQWHFRECRKESHTRVTDKGGDAAGSQQQQKDRISNRSRHLPLRFSWTWKLWSQKQVEMQSVTQKFDKQNAPLYRDRRHRQLAMLQASLIIILHFAACGSTSTSISLPLQKDTHKTVYSPYPSEDRSVKEAIMQSS